VLLYFKITFIKSLSRAYYVPFAVLLLTACLQWCSSTIALPFQIQNSDANNV
jgi:hypothetical protein